MLIDPVIKYRDRMSQHLVTHTLQKYCTWTFFFKWMNFTSVFVLRNDLQVRFCSNCSVISSSNTVTLLKKSPYILSLYFPMLGCQIDWLVWIVWPKIWETHFSWLKLIFISSHWLRTVVLAVLLFVNGLLEVFFPEGVWQE